MLVVQQNAWYRLRVYEHTDFRTIREELSAYLCLNCMDMSVFSYPDETCVYEEKSLHEAGIVSGMSFLLA